MYLIKRRCWLQLHRHSPRYASLVVSLSDDLAVGDDVTLIAPAGMRVLAAHALGAYLDLGRSRRVSHVCGLPARVSPS